MTVATGRPGRVRWWWVVLAGGLLGPVVDSMGQNPGPDQANAAAAADEGLRAIGAIEAAFRQAIDRARPSVVSVFVVARPELRLTMNPLPRSGGLDDALRDPVSVGSGVVLDRSGAVLTCYHVVRAVVEQVLAGREQPDLIIKVLLSDGSTFDASPHAADPRSDLAVIRPAVGGLEGLAPITIGDGSKLFPGQFVLALGNPFGVAADDGSISASWGIVSNIRRRAVPPLPPSELEEWRETLVIHPTLIQTDARLNMGISGGALIDTRGQLVGVTMALAAATGFETPGGFAVPIDDLTRRIIETLRQGQEVEYGFVGIKPQDITPELAAREGAQPVHGAKVVDISRVVPAARCGLEPGDIIVAVQGQPVRNSTDLILAVGTQKVGSRLTMRVVRGQKAQDLEVPLAKYPLSGPIFVTKKSPAWNGIRVDHLSVVRELLFQGLVGNPFEPVGPTIRSGVVIREVEAGSLAELQSLRAGQIITAVNGKPIFSPEEFLAATAQAKPPVRLETHLGREHVFDAPARPSRE